MKIHIEKSDPKRAVCKAAKACGELERALKVLYENKRPYEAAATYREIETLNEAVLKLKAQSHELWQESLPEWGDEAWHNAPQLERIYGRPMSPYDGVIYARLLGSCEGAD